MVKTQKNIVNSFHSLEFLLQPLIVGYSVIIKLIVQHYIIMIIDIGRSRH